MNVSAVIVAAGTSNRMNNGVDKLLLRVYDRPLLSWTISRFESAISVDEIILVVREDNLDYVRDELLPNEDFKKVTSVVAGGSNRQRSTENGLKEVSSDADIVLVHDGARPIVHPDDIDLVSQKANESGAAILAIKSRDTIKEVLNGQIVNTMNRDAIWLAQTPQAFRKEILTEALNRANSDSFIGTDEASLVERIDKSVSIVEGRSNNVKVTYREDIQIVERFFQEESLID